MIRLLAFLLLLPQFLAAQQDCRCCTKQAEGQALFDKKQYEAAIDKWKYAAGLSDKDKCPNLTSLISKAQQRIRERDEAAAQARRDKEKREAADARQRRADEAWNYIRLATNPEPFDQFLRDYPDSRQAPDARRLVNKYKPQPSQPPTPQKVEASAAVASFLVKIPGGTFSMGDQFGEGSDNERPTHNVTLGDFYLSKYEVSFDEFDAFCSATGREKPSDNGWGRGKRPAINVDWYDAIEYCNWLSTQHGLRAVYSIDKTTQDPNNKNTNDTKKWSVKADWSANGYRLPTEAEWEYAARARALFTRHGFEPRSGSSEVRFGNGRDVLDPSQINFDARSDYKKSYSVVGEYRQQTVAVDALSANAFGLENMSGNVWEWCWDWYDGEIYKNTEGAQDPKGGTSGAYRVLRGGSWNDIPESCRASNRNSYRPNDRIINIGFRVARHL